MKPFSVLRFAFRFVIAIFLLLQIGTSGVQAQHPPRYAKNAGFVITGQTGFDRGYYWGWDTTHEKYYHERFTPPDSIYNTHYRYFLELHLDTLGLNCERRNFTEWPDSAGVKFGDYAPRDTVLAHTNTIRSTYLTGASILSSIQGYNAYTRFELERHDTANYHLGLVVPSRTPSIRYPMFLKTTGLTGSNVAASGATYPLYLRGTSIASDTALNAVRMVKGTDTIGYFDSAYYPNTFISPIWDSTHPWDVGKIVKKLMFRFRVKIENISSLDTLSLVKSRNDSIFRITLSQDGYPVTVDTVIRAQAFVHEGAWDTIDVPFISRLKQNITRVRLKWLGKISLTADYMDVLTRPLTLGDNVDSLQGPGFSTQSQLDQMGYQTLTANRDSLLRQIVGHQDAKAYDGEMNFWWMQEEEPIGNLDLFKRMVKIFHDSSHIEPMIIIHDSLEQNDPNDVYKHGNFYGWGLPNVVQYQLEGVRLGWLDSSLYADPRFFVIEPYPFDSYLSQPRRIAAQDSATLWQWTKEHDAIRPNKDITFYNKEDYRYRSFVKYFGYVNSHRQAQRITLRNSEPNFKHRFFTSWQDGASTLSGSDTNGNGVVFLNERAPTGAEIKTSGHLALSTGSSGLLLYTIFSTNVAKNPYGVYNGGIFRYDGDHSASLDTITLRNADGSYSLRWTWMGWKERYDTVKKLLPLLRLYGDTLLNSKYQGDYWAYELHKLTSPGTLAFDPSTLSAHPDTNITPDVYSSDSIANRTHVHISQWVDTLSSNDTLLYITNTRSDDSWNPDSTAGTFDTRYISLQLRANHLVSDVADTARLYRLDGSKVRTPYVHAGEKLIVRLLPGDGVLVRLANVDTTAKHQMQIALDFPKPPPLAKAQSDFFDHGRIKFDQYVEGAQQADSTAPSSRFGYVSIKDTVTTSFFQNSISK